MSKHVSFPAAHLSAHEIGKRIQVITVDGVKIADTMTGLFISRDDDRKGVTRIFVMFENVKSYYSHEIDPEQFVKRADEL